MRLPAFVLAFLDGFAFGGIFPARRPSAPDYFFIPEDEQDDAEPGDQP